jgi:hypothetical protein
MPFLNSVMLWPMDRASAGNRDDPKINRTMATSSRIFQVNRESPGGRRRALLKAVHPATYYQFYKMPGGSQTTADSAVGIV